MNNEFEFTKMEKDLERYRGLWKKELATTRKLQKRVNRLWLLIAVIALIPVIVVYCKNIKESKRTLDEFLPTGYEIAFQVVQHDSAENVSLEEIMADICNDNPMMSQIPRAPWKKAIRSINKDFTGDIYIPVFVQMIDPPEFDENDFY